MTNGAALNYLTAATNEEPNRPVTSSGKRSPKFLITLASGLCVPTVRGRRL